MQVSSTSFRHGQDIPQPYTCYGQGISPALRISDVPSGTQSLAIVVHDPDSPKGDFIHWTVWNISAATTTIPAHHTPTGATEGLNSFGNLGWGAPCPNQGTHHYVFDVYALNSQINLKSGAQPGALLHLLPSHTIAKAQLIGTVSAQ